MIPELKNILDPIGEKYGFRVGYIDRSIDLRDSITYFSYYEKEEDYADDEATCEKIFIQIDVWSNRWIEELNTDIDVAMSEIFNKEAESPDLFEEDTGIHHKALRYSIKKRRG